MSDTRLTPMMRQYRDIKQAHPDAIVFFRLGDFYEMFEQDALVAARELELTLTSRGGKSDETRMPMCGVPHHAADHYVHKLVRRGYKVALCEQVEDPAVAVGLTRREVIQVITPGTVDDPEKLTRHAHNFLAAVSFDGESVEHSTRFGLVFADVSTGEAFVTELPSLTALREELQRVQPVEILVTQPEIVLYNCTHTLCQAPSGRETQQCFEKLAALGPHKLREFPCAELALGLWLGYAQRALKVSSAPLQKIQFYRTGDYMQLDAATRRNLELTESFSDARRADKNLFTVLNFTRTAMGARLLKQWLYWPLLSKEAILGRQDAVAELAADVVLREELKAFLKDVYDLRRLTVRLSAEKANPRDLLALAHSLLVLPSIVDSLALVSAALLRQTAEHLAQATVLQDMAQTVKRSLLPQPPVWLTEGGIMAAGVSPELDELKQAAQDGRAWLAALEAREKDKTGIKTVKVGYNKVFGYYLEVSKGQLAQVPAYYIRKQTLSTGERFITEELKEKENVLLHAAERALKLEQELFIALRQKAAAHTAQLYAVSECLAQLDVLLSLAEAAVQYGWQRPEFNAGERLLIMAGRHPVVEAALPRGNFVPNDVALDKAGCRFMLLTGPNMAGKSTFLRQVGLTVLLAQTGSFVPAQMASLPLIDRVFTRVGAQDDLAGGRSTFMVEMHEAAQIVSEATANSLLLIDEVGRGTSTFDGMAIAAALAEHLHDAIGAFVIFSTHYHELTQLPRRKTGIQNFNVAVEDQGDTVVFLHRVEPGPAPGSYGIHVAKMAGLPPSIIERAEALLTALEKSGGNFEGRAKQLQLF